ncbi:MAG: hypothetical protein R6X09_01520 [Bacteroidales bacterium]
MKTFKLIKQLISAGMLAILLNGCCTRHFVIQTEPEKAMVIMGSVPNHFGLPDEICGEGPLNKTVTFMGKNHTCYFTALKRGYETDTVTVNKNSELTVNLRLRKMENQNAAVPVIDETGNATFYMLPVNADIILHKGVGNLDKYERSDKLSKEAYDSLNGKLTKACISEHMQFIPDERFPDPQSWRALSDSLKEYLLTLKTPLLPYYPLPPAIQEPALNLIRRAVHQSDTANKADSSKVMLVYVWCKSVEPTAGRVIGNVAANIGAGAVQGYEMATYGHAVTVYDPQAFALDNHTLWMLYTIDLQSGQIVKIQQRSLPFAITKPKYRNEFVTLLTDIPNLINTADHEK